MMRKIKYKNGFSLTEIVVGTAVFLTVALAVYGAYVGVFKLANANQARLLAVQLADEQYEILRNMPYSNIGEVNGIPKGTIPSDQTVSRGGFTFNINTTIRNVDLPYDGQVGSSTFPDLKPADNKLAQINITCLSCVDTFTPVFLVGQIAPKNVEASSTNGSIKIQVYDSSGNGIQGASVHVENIATSTPIIVDDTSDDYGLLQVIDVPPGTQAYYVSATKTGYSTDRTYTPSGQNPTPLKPNVTVAAQQLSAVSLSIDKLATLNFNSVSPMCQAKPNYHFHMTGAKQIGASIPKYSQDLSTNGSGSLNLNSMEWDTYTVNSNDSTYYLAGINPLNPLTVGAGSTQTVQLIVVPKSSNGLLVTVKDSSTHLPISDAVVQLTGSSYSNSQSTNQGYMNQVDWSQGSGQSMFSNLSQYWFDDGNVDTSTSSGNIYLKKVFGQYNTSGYLESSTFDTGTSSNFYTISWSPATQAPSTGTSSVKFQFATNSVIDGSETWNYKGPDGTSNTYYTTPNSTISSVHNNNQFARYKVYLSTASQAVSPQVSQISFTYTSGCIPPGQVLFQGLSAGTYTINVSKSGYTSYSGSVTVGSGWQEQQISLSP